jgi:hypothetical protein
MQWHTKKCCHNCLHPTDPQRRVMLRAWLNGALARSFQTNGQMTLRITPSGPGPPARFALDGRLTGDEVAELRRVVAEVEGHVALDLTGLQFADRPGVNVLRELKAQGARFIGASPYLELLLGDVPHDAAN